MITCRQLLLLLAMAPICSAVFSQDNGVIDLTKPGAPPPVDATLVMPNNNQPQQENPEGGAFGDLQPRSRVIEKEKYAAERSPVYPEDPNSAWWEVNVRHAFAKAQREVKPMLLLFTSQHRQEAMALSLEVFATKSFNEYVKENLVICYLSYPLDPNDAPDSLRWAKKEFKVGGLPTVLIFNHKGEVERSLRGYRKGRPVDYFNELKSVCAPAIAEANGKKQSMIANGYREWKNEEGNMLFAKFLRRDDYLMTLLDGRGQEWTIAIKQLCTADREVARSHPRLDEVMRASKKSNP